MAFGLWNRAAQKWAITKWRTSPIERALEEHTRSYVSGNTILGSHSEEFKRKLVEQFYEQVAAIGKADDPFLKCRAELGYAVVSYSRFQVLCLKPEEKMEAFYADCPYISGELYRNIRYCAQHNGELAQILSQHELTTDDNLIAFANARSCAFLYFMNGINLLRAEVGDPPLTEWFRPFVKSMLIWQENVYRDKVGLRTILPERAEDAWRHSSFLNLVINGHRDPLGEWEVIHKVAHKDLS